MCQSAAFLVVEGSQEFANGQLLFSLLLLLLRITVNSALSVLQLQALPVLGKNRVDCLLPPLLLSLLLLLITDNALSVLRLQALLMLLGKNRVHCRRQVKVSQNI